MTKCIPFVCTVLFAISLLNSFSSVNLSAILNTHWFVLLLAWSCSSALDSHTAHLAEVFHTCLFPLFLFYGCKWQPVILASNY